jgi:hypothetical protein
VDRPADCLLCPWLAGAIASARPRNRAGPRTLEHGLPRVRSSAGTLLAQIGEQFEGGVRPFSSGRSPDGRGHAVSLAAGVVLDVVRNPRNSWWISSVVRVFVLLEALLEGGCDAEHPPRNEKVIGSIPDKPDHPVITTVTPGCGVSSCFRLGRVATGSGVGLVPIQHLEH